MKEKTPDVGKKTGLARCLEIAEDRRIYVILSGVFSALSSLCSFVPYVSIYYVIKEIIFVYPTMSSLDLRQIGIYALISIIGVSANVAFYFISIILAHIGAFGTSQDLRLEIVDHLRKVHLGYHISMGTGRLRKIISANVKSVENFLAHRFSDLISAFVSPLVLIAILLLVDIRLGLASIVGVILAFVLQYVGYGGKEAKENMNNYSKASEDLNSATVEYVRNLPVVKIFNNTSDSFGNIKTNIRNYSDWALKFALSWINYYPGFRAIIANIYLFILPVGFWIGQRTTNLEGFITTLIFYIIISPALASALEKIMYVSDAMVQLDTDMRRIDQVLNVEPLVDTSDFIGLKSYDIEFDNVSFSYDGINSALNDLSFKARDNTITAIVGPSGSGKSTVANLIARFWDIELGSIKIGGFDIKDIPQKQLNTIVSYVFQDNFLFPISIKDNIKIGKPDASDKDVIEAAKKARCHDFVSKLEYGYDTVYGSKGTRLSGGEVQRIAIARAIISNSPVLILDEATAFTDAENEYLIQQAFEELMKGKTVIMIAHRLSTIVNADNIIVLNEGGLDSTGKHNQLLLEDGLYKKMWNSYTFSKNWVIGADHNG